MGYRTVYGADERFDQLLYIRYHFAGSVSVPQSLKGHVFPSFGRPDHLGCNTIRLNHIRAFSCGQRRALHVKRVSFTASSSLTNQDLVGWETCLGFIFE